MNMTKLTRTRRGAFLWTGILAMAASPLAAQTCQILGPQQTMIPGAQSFAVGDLNNDGKDDIAAVVGGNLEIYLSTGASFAPPVVVPAALGAVFIGDVNNDGREDIIGFSTNAHDVVVYLNHGDGTFGLGRPYRVGLNPALIAIGDLNGDGFADLAVTIHGATTLEDGQLAVLLNNGQGGFDPPQLYPTGLNPNGVVIADFNQDGHNDVAVVNYGYEFNNTSPYPGSAMIFTGSATGALSLSQAIQLGPQAGLATVGDFNGDGYPDIAVAVVNGNDQTPGVFSVLLNNRGSFGSVTDWPTGASPAGIRVGDFNQDGYLDLAVTNSDVTADDIIIYFNDGTGNFTSSQTFYDGYAPAGVAVGDFNGDRKLDAAVFNAYTSNVSLFYSQLSRPTVNLTSSPNPSQTGQTVTLTAAVSVPILSGCVTAGGTVTFLDSGKPIWEPVALNNRDEAVVTDSTLTSGTHSLSARFKPAAPSLVGRGISNSVSQVVQ